MINYRGTPLFGKDSSVSHTSEFFAITGTVLFWIIFLIFSLVLKPQPKKQYKEVQIVLSSTPVVQKTEESPAPAEQAAASAASESSSEPIKKTVETPAPKKVETPKPKKQLSPKIETPTKYAIDFSDGPKFPDKKKITNYDDNWEELDMLDEALPEKDDIIKVENQSTISGLGGKSVNDSDNKIISEMRNIETNNNTSDSTKKTLTNISETEGQETESGSNTGSDGDSFTDENNITWANKGKARLLKNSLDKNLTTPITLTQTVSVKITFTVDKNGLVLKNTIELSNATSLSSEVRFEMEKKISNLQFVSGDTEDRVSFVWNLSPKPNR